MHITRRMLVTSGLALAGYAIATATACSSDDQDTVGPNVADAVVVLSGSGQTAVLGDPLTDSVAVYVSNTRGNPVSGATVTWAVASGGGSVSPGTSVTNASGIAKAAWTLGKGATGENKLSATVDGVAAPAAFTATAAPLTFTSTMSGAQESPSPTASTATGTTIMSWDGQQLTYQVTVNGTLASNVTGAHIHGPAADTTTNAAVILNFKPDNTKNTGVIASGTASATSGNLTVATIGMDSVITLLRARKAYTNVHSSVYPAGEIRGTPKSP